MADYYWGEQSYVAPDEAGSSALETINHGPFWQHALLKYGIGLMATVVELLHLYYDMMISVLNMTEVVKLQLYPLTPERAFLVHGFTNVALEVGFSQLPNYGKCILACRFHLLPETVHTAHDFRTGLGTTLAYLWECLLSFLCECNAEQVSTPCATSPSGGST